eukprot:3260199-Pyramimonas_sp.AAC.1
MHAIGTRMRSYFCEDVTPRPDHIDLLAPRTGQYTWTQPTLVQVSRPLPCLLVHALNCTSLALL